MPLPAVRQLNTRLLPEPLADNINRCCAVFQVPNSNRRAPEPSGPCCVWRGESCDSPAVNPSPACIPGCIDCVVLPRCRRRSCRPAPSLILRKAGRQSAFRAAQEFSFRPVVPVVEDIFHRVRRTDPFHALRNGCTPLRRKTRWNIRSCRRAGLFRLLARVFPCSHGQPRQTG